MSDRPAWLVALVVSAALALGAVLPLLYVGFLLFVGSAPDGVLVVGVVLLAGFIIYQFVHGPAIGRGRYAVNLGTLCATWAGLWLVSEVGGSRARNLAIVVMLAGGGS